MKKKPKPKLSPAQKMMLPLLADVRHCIRKCKLPHPKQKLPMNSEEWQNFELGSDQFWRRSLVRAVFAYVEAHSHAIRKCVMEIMASRKPKRIPISKIALLQDLEYEIDKTGKLSETQLKIKTLHHLALTMRMFAKAKGKTDQYIEKQIFGVNQWRLSVAVEDKTNFAGRTGPQRA